MLLMLLFLIVSAVVSHYVLQIFSLLLLLFLSVLLMFLLAASIVSPYCTCCFSAVVVVSHCCCCCSDAGQREEAAGSGEQDHGPAQWDVSEGVGEHTQHPDHPTTAQEGGRPRQTGPPVSSSLSSSSLFSDCVSRLCCICLFPNCLPSTGMVPSIPWADIHQIQTCYLELSPPPLTLYTPSTSHVVPSLYMPIPPQPTSSDHSLSHLYSLSPKFCTELSMIILFSTHPCVIIERHGLCLAPTQQAAPDTCCIHPALHLKGILQSVRDSQHLLTSV